MLVWSNSSSLLVYNWLFFQAEDGIRDLVRSRGLGDVYKRQGKYLVKGTSDYLSKLNDILQSKFGINSEDEKQLIPKEYSLHQNYPNPFNPSTTIKFDLPNDGLVQLEIFDILGRRITTLVNEYKNAGSYEQQFDASNLASGVYVYKLQAGDFVSSKKMILLKWF